MPRTAPMHFPEREELEHNLRDHGIDVETRVAYVLDLLAPARAHADAIEKLEKEIDRRDHREEGMRTELRSLRQKLGDLSPSERAALDQKFEMLGKINQARGRVATLKAQLHRAIDDGVRDVEKALEK